MVVETAPLEVEVGITLNKLLRELSRAEARMVKTARKMEGDFVAANRKASRASSATGQALSNAFSRQRRAQIQNIGFQVGDFATQVGAGTRASVALGQQLPQLLGGFGALGAVLGAAVAVGVPLAASLLSIGDNSETTEEKIKRLAESVQNLEDKIKRASFAGREELTQAFGEVTASVLALVEAEKQLALLNATEDLRQVQEALSGIANVGIEENGQFFRRDSALASNIRQVAKEFELTTEQAEQFRAALVDVAQAQGPEELAAAYSNARAVLVGLVGGWDNLSETQREVVANLNKGQEAAELMGSAISSATFEASSLSQEVNRAADAAVRFVNSLGQASLAGIQAELAAVQAGAGRADAAAARREAEIRSNPDFQEALQATPGLRREALEGLQREVELTRQQVAAQEQLSELRREQNKAGRTGAGGASEIEKASLAYDRLLASLDPAVAAQMRFEAGEKAVEEALRLGIITTDQAAAAKDRLREKLDGSTQAALTFDQSVDSISDALAGTLTEAENFGESTARIFRKIAADILASGIKEAIQGVFGGLGSIGGGGGGLLGGIVGALFNAKGNVFQGGKVTAFARGGVVNSATAFPMQGGVGIMGEAGPEAIMPLARGADGKLGVRAAGGGSGGVVEVVVRSDTHSIGAHIERVSGQVSARMVRAGLEQYDSKVLPGSVERINGDPRRIG